MLAVLYDLMFNEGYAATSGPLIRTDLCAEAVRLARELAALMPDEPEVLGLLALLLLTEARRPARGWGLPASWCCFPSRTDRCGTGR